MTDHTWKMILHELKKATGDRLLDLNPPATSHDIHSLEDCLSLNLPDSFKKYLKIFNGQAHINDDPNHYSPLIGFNYFLSTQDIVETWNMMNELFEDEEPIDWVNENKIKPVIWSKRWIPFTDFESSRRLILDLDPGKNGTWGQVFCYHSGMNYEEVIADSFDKFSVDILQRLQQHHFTMSEDIIQFNDDYI